MEGDTLTIWPDSKDLRDFARITTFNRGFEPKSSKLYYLYLQNSINKLFFLKKKLTMVKPPLTSQVSGDEVFERLTSSLLTAYLLQL